MSGEEEILNDCNTIESCIKKSKAQRSSYAPLFSRDSMEEITAYLEFNGLRKRSQRNGYLYYTCKVSGCKMMMRIKKLPNINIVAWNGKNHNCNGKYMKRNNSLNIKSQIDKCFLEGVKPKDINNFLKIENSYIPIEIKQIRDYFYQLKRQSVQI
uniref:FLYWCH-type domain-containing protein n=1 Tax=Strongyloides papillosus TaxID=174720 RepID=A0A0N5CI83_STREA